MCKLKMKIKLDKIASSTRNARLKQEVSISPELVAAEGYIIIGRVLNEKNTYNTLELLSGRMSRLCRGDLIAGVLGMRNALRGYSGVVPDTLKLGDTLQILNLGGVCGICTSENPELGPPINIEVLGAALHFPSITERIGNPAHIMKDALPKRSELQSAKPLVIISGTCMNAGKTRAACEIVKQLNHRGLKIGAAKLTGISLMRDTLEMLDYGAEHALNFTDAGIVCTRPTNVVEVSKGIVHELSSKDPDCIVLELGDGIMGEYGVMEILLDAELMSYVKAHVLAANDPVGAWGAAKYLAGRCPKIDVICGPSTDNKTGVNFIQEKLQIAAANALTHGEELGRIVLQNLFRE